MDLSTILSDLLRPTPGSDVAHAPEASAGLLPSLSFGGASPTPQAPAGTVGQMPMPPAPQGPQPGGHGNMIRDLAPLLIAAVTGARNPLHGAAIAHGSYQGMMAAQQENLDAEQRDEQKRMLAGRFLQQTAADVQRLQSPMDRQNYLNLAEQIGVQQFGMSQGWTKQIPAHDEGHDVFAALKTELAGKLAAFDKDKKWASVAGTPGEAKVSFQLSNGQSIPVNMARQLVGQAVYDSSGKQAFAPASPDDAPENKTDYSRFLTRYAQKLGKKSANDLTADEELGARRAFGQADDRTPKGTDPILEQIRALTLANLQKASGGELSPGQATAAGKLSDDFRQESKNFLQVAQAYGRVKASASDPSAAGDLALVFNYMKTLDPGSTVREGEFATAQNAGGVDDRIVAMYNKVRSGERLSAPQRADFLDRSRRLYTQALTQQRRLEQQYRDRAKAVNVPDKYVVTDYTVQDEPAATAPGAAGKPIKVGKFTVTPIGGGR